MTFRVRPQEADVKMQAALAMGTLRGVAILLRPTDGAFLF